MTFADILNDKEGRQAWQNATARSLCSMSLLQIYALLDQRYRLAFFELVNQDLSQEDFSQLWASIWTESEGVNSFEVLSMKQCLDYFRQSIPKILMDKDDYAKFKQLPDEVIIYRGICPRKDQPLPPDDKATNALSWTLSQGKARYFSTRFLFSEDDTPGVVYKATIEKAHVLAYFNVREEQEVIVDPKHLKDIQKV